MLWTGAVNEIALYDLDKTLTRKPTYTPFLLYAAWRHRPWRLILLPIVILVSLGYYLLLIGRARLKEINQALLLGGPIPQDRLKETAERFAERTMEDNVYPQAVARIAGDREAGREVVLATASFAFYVLPLAQRLGIGEIVATVSRYDDDGSVLARIEGENCYGDGKLRMLEAWLADQGLRREDVRIRFHSDSSSDLPVFEWADEPVAVNPSPKLRRIAEQRGWQIIAWG